MKPTEIRAELLRRGVTSRDIARELALTDGTITSVIHGWGKSSRVAKKLSEITGKSVSELFPGRYDAPKKRRAAKRKVKG